MSGYRRGLASEQRRGYSRATVVLLRLLLANSRGIATCEFDPVFFQNITLELHTGLEMLRDGRKDPMINLDIHHNSTNINKSTKIEIAADIAELMWEHLDIERDRLDAQ